MTFEVSFTLEVTNYLVVHTGPEFSVCFGHGGPSVSRMTLSVPLSLCMGVTLQADPGLAEPCADWALENRSCRWARGC